MRVPLLHYSSDRHKFKVMKNDKKNKISSRGKIQAYGVLVLLIMMAVLVSQWNVIFRKPVETKKPTTEISSPQLENVLLKGLDPSLVCMVNDTYMAKKQIPVPVGDKIYYGCCEGCVGTLTNKSESRHAIDPFNGSTVDKASAFIVLVPESQGKVLYFNSEENYKNFVQKK